MRRKPQAPLPLRDGVAPARLHLPGDGNWSTLREYLHERLAHLGGGEIDRMLANGCFVGTSGPLSLDAAYTPGSHVWFHTDPPAETPVPDEVRVLHRDENLLVVDKPHFLATMPRGRHVRETALVRLRRDLDLPELSPAHRLDRLTAGLLMFVIHREHRGAYQNMFRDRGVTRIYEAIAPHDPTLVLPRTVRNRIVKEHGLHSAYESVGEPNSETHIELLEHHQGLGRYRLHPTTGRTHQLRLHMSGLGVPIRGDDLYPTPVQRAPDDFGQPLQLLARTLSFTDPITGHARQFHSSRELGAAASRPDGFDEARQTLAPPPTIR